MQETRTEPLGALVQRFTDYLPTLTAGLLVLALGLVLGWVAKRAVIRVLIWLRLDRLAGRVGWRSALGRGDARAAVYDLLGNLALTVVGLVFLDNALTIWGLAVLSRLLDSLVFSLPRIALAGLIVAAGITVSTAAAERARDALEDEGLAHAGLLGKALKAMLLAVVAALGLWELNFARQIVLSAFIIAFGAMGIAFALSVGLGSSRAIQRAWDELFQDRKDRSE
jgi:Mechanosensitive ion channel, conserved TM helix